MSDPTTHSGTGGSPDPGVDATAPLSAEDAIWALGHLVPTRADPLDEIDPEQPAFRQIGITHQYPGVDPAPLDSGPGFKSEGLTSAIVRVVQDLLERVAALESGTSVTEGSTLTDLLPDTAVCGSADFILHVHGEGFTDTSVIVWNNIETPTAHVDATHITMYVSPAGWSTPVSVPVQVRTDGTTSNTLHFQFTAAT